MTRSTVTITESVDLDTQACINCGVLFAMPVELHERRRHDGRDFFCPNGHPMTYGDSDAERIGRELDKVRSQLAQARGYEAEAQAALEGERRAHAATKGHLTRARRRAAAGVCLHCHRSFANVARHMAAQHPEALAEAGVQPQHADPLAAKLDGGRADG